MRRVDKKFIFLYFFIGFSPILFAQNESNQNPNPRIPELHSDSDGAIIPTAVETHPYGIGISSNPIWKTRNDEEIVSKSNEFLKNLFGDKWFDHYSVFRIKKNNILSPDYFKNSKEHLSHAFVVFVEYSFSGPKNLKSISDDKIINGVRHAWVGPWMIFHLDCTEANDSGILKFEYGSNIVPPYDVAKLISAQTATDTAKKAGYDVQFSSLSLITTPKMLGKISLLVPGYSTVFKNSGMVEVNAEDSSILYRGFPTGGPILVPITSQFKKK